MVCQIYPYFNYIILFSNSHDELVIPYLASIFKMLDDDTEINELEIDNVCIKLAIGRKAVLNREDIIKNAETRLIPQGGNFEAQPSLVEILSARYQEKVLFGRAAVALTRFQNLDEIICNKCSF